MPHQDGIEPIGIGRKIGRPGNNVAQGFVGSLLQRGIDPFDDHAARVAGSGKQHG